MPRSERTLPARRCGDMRAIAKTLIVKALARSLDLDFKRVQFTP
ncbi:MAG: hypothetical protein EBT03_11460, partial [Betaproteobacteria bacterium]|nr:hypothetical protein [Betaproteobacteria bacterium]